MEEAVKTIENITEKDYLLVIDGSSLLTTQFFGNLPKEIMFAKTQEEKERFFYRIMQTSKGVYTNAVYGFVRVLMKVLKEQHPTYLAVTWDVTRDTFRREIYPDYKGNRGDSLPPLKDQFILCQELLTAMKIPQFMDRRYEADDFSGTLAAKFENQVPVRIITKDNDYLQLVSDQTNIWMLHSTAKKTEELYQKYGLNQKKINAPDRTFPFTKELVEKEFGVEPENVNSLKGLQGDPSDNIKGVPGVGETTAALLIGKYKTVEALYDVIRDLDEAGKKKISEFWKTELGLKRSPINYLLKTSETDLTGEKAALLSKLLATIKRDIPLPDVTLDSLKLNIDKEKAQEEFERLEFKSLKFEEPQEQGWTSAGEENPFADGTEDETGEQVIFHKSAIAVPPEDFMNPPMKEEDTIVVPEPGKKKTSVKKAEEPFTSMPFSFNLSACHFAFSKAEAEKEWNYLLEAKGNAAAVSVCWDEDGMYGISIAVSSGECSFLSVGSDDSAMFSDNLAKLTKHKQFIACYQLKRLLTYLPSFYECKTMFDIEIAAYLLNPLKGTYPIAEMRAEYFSVQPESAEGEAEKPLDLSAYRMFPEEAAKALCFQSSIILKLASVFADQLEKTGMKELFETIEMPLVYTLYDMEQRGIKVKKEALKVYGDHLAVGIRSLEQEIYTMAGEEFNINSPKQLGPILFEKLKLSNGKKTKTGYSTAADVLERIAEEHPIVSKILEYRQLTKLKSTYADGLAVFIGTDNRIHGKFHQTVAATGRISSTDPNLQNIPVRLALGKEIRKVFVPEDGYVFLDADYSQIELRVLAHMSGDERLREAYRTAEDIHRITASQVFHMPLEQVTNEQRSNAKAVNFGIVYGISSFGLGQGLNISRHEAEDYIERYFETYPNVKQFLDKLVDQGRENGYVTTMFGRRRPVTELVSSNYVRRSGEERIAMNSPIQGTAADIIKIAMIHVNERLKERKLKSRLLLQIHDELLVETHQDEIEIVKDIMKDEMQQAVKFSVPLEVEVKQGNNWFEAK